MIIPGNLSLRTFLLNKLQQPHLSRASRQATLHYICIDWRHLSEILAAGRDVYDGLKNLCVWTKDNAGLGSFYRSQHELICVFQKEGSSRNNIQLGRFGRNRTNVWRYPGANSFARATDEGNLLSMHATTKPVSSGCRCHSRLHRTRRYRPGPFWG